MRILTAICLLLAGSAFAVPIPDRDAFFESRPGWWWNIWLGRVVVLEGKIKFKKSDEPDIRIEFNKGRLKDIIPDDKARDLQLKLGDFQVGELEILKFHYADGGASDSDGNLQQMSNGVLKRIKVLIPIMRMRDDTMLYGSNLQPDVENIGIHVFDYTSLFHGLNLVYSSSIPNENIMDAHKIFKLREKQWHTGVNRTSNPKRGYAGFNFQLGGDAAVIGTVIPGTPANKIGLRTGDVILSINGEKIADPDRGVMEKLSSIIAKWRAGDQIEIEIQRGKEIFELRIKLISNADLQKLMKSEQDGADQPATAPQLKSEGKEKPKPEAEVRPR